jgi:hypothetical protein
MTLAELRQLYALLSKFMNDRSFLGVDHIYFREVRQRIADHILARETSY